MKNAVDVAPQPNSRRGVWGEWHIPPNLTFLAVLLASTPAATKAATFTTLFNFGVNGRTDTNTPVGRLIVYKGQLYGVSFHGGLRGAVFVSNPTSGATKVVYSFANGFDAASPQFGLTANGNSFYGITPVGGANNLGAIYAINALSGTEAVIEDFAATPEANTPFGTLAIGAGKKYGTQGTLYGATLFGGVADSGTLYAYDIGRSLLNVLHDFSGGEGLSPAGSPILFDNTLYGTMTAGGPSGCGTVYKADPFTGVTSLLYAFKCVPDGRHPSAPPVLYNLAFYGVTGEGGATDNGTIFTLNFKTGAETLLHSFAGGTDGTYPNAPLVEFNGKLYGTTLGDATKNIQGTLFSFDPATGVEAVLHSFPINHYNAHPNGLVVFKNRLYGTTQNGGTNNSGTLFSYTP